MLAEVSSNGQDGRRILAMGGGGFTMAERGSGLDRMILSLTGKPVPKICFLPTASGDPREQTTRFLERFGAWPCEPSVLSLFHLGRDRLDPVCASARPGRDLRRRRIDAEHARCLAVSTASPTRHAARGRPVLVLAGLSAGAMCWFEGGITMSAGAPEAASGLGLLPGSMSVHLDGEPERLPAYRAAVATGLLPAGYAVDDCAALLFAGTELERCVASRPGARALRVAPDGDGGTTLVELPVELLPGPPSHGESDGVSELRALRLGRHRWD